MSGISAALVKELRERTGAGMMECKAALVEANADLDEAVTVLRKRGVAKAEKRASKVAAEGIIVISVAADHKSAFMAEVNSETDFVARDTHFVDFANAVAVQGLNAKTQNFVGLTGVEEARQLLVQKIGENVQLRRAAFLESNGCVVEYNHGSRIGVLVALSKDNRALARDIAMHIAASNPRSIGAADLDPTLIAKEREIFVDQAKQTGKPDAIIEKMVEGRIAKYIKEVCLEGQPFVRNPDQTVGALLKAAAAEVQAFVRFEVGEGIEKEVIDFAEEVRAQVQRS